MPCFGATQVAAPIFTGSKLGNMFELTLCLGHHRKKLGPRPRSRRDTSSAEFLDYRLGVHVPNFFLLRNVGIEGLVMALKLSIILMAKKASKNQ